MTGPPEANEDWIGGWHIGPLDRAYAGDFDSDGRSEIFIRSARWGGLLAFDGGLSTPSG
jgi:hypothetical protein